MAAAVCTAVWVAGGSGCSLPLSSGVGCCRGRRPTGRPTGRRQRHSGGVHCSVGQWWVALAAAVQVVGGSDGVGLCVCSKPPDLPEATDTITAQPLTLALTQASALNGGDSGGSDGVGLCVCSTPPDLPEATDTITAQPLALTLTQASASRSGGTDGSMFLGPETLGSKHSAQQCCTSRPKTLSLTHWVQHWHTTDNLPHCLRESR